MFIAALSTIAKICKDPKCQSTDEWIKKMWCVCVYIHTHMCTCVYIHTYVYTTHVTYTCIHTYTHVYIHTYTGKLAIKKNEILPSATMWMELEGIMLSEIDRYHMISLICGI